MLRAMGGGEAKHVAVKAVRRAGRKRRVVGWALVVSAVLIAASFVASRWWSVYGRRERLAAGIVSGQGFVALLDGVDNEWHVSQISAKYRELRWLTDEPQPSILQIDFNLGVLMQVHTDYSREWTFALWPWPVVLGGTGAWLVRSGVVARRRVATGSCRACGYSLVGLERGTSCPECGKGGGAHE
ncbi:MAG: hypothetical protein QM783_03665 [Phycisphaerales bacterium]